MPKNMVISMKSRNTRHFAFLTLLLAALPFTPVGAVFGDTPPSSSAPAVQSIDKAQPGASLDVAISEAKQKALDLEKGGKLDESAKTLIEILGQKPDDQALLDQLARVDVLRAEQYARKKKYEEALNATRQALSASPNDTPANQMLSRLYKELGADPDNVVNRLRVADALYSQGRYAEAKVEYLASLPVKITAPAYVGLGRVAEKLKGTGAGRSDFEAALQIDANSSSAHCQMGICYLNENNVVSANSELSRALILDQTNREAGESLVKLWKNQVARLADANSHLGLARAYQLMGDLKSAQDEYKIVVELDPQNPSLPAARQSFKLALTRQKAANDIAQARALQAQGQLTEAYKKAFEATGLSPRNSEYKLYQGELLQRMGQPASAKQVYMSILEYDPKNITAAQRIKQIEIAMTGGRQLPVSTLPPPAVSRQPAGFPGTKFPAEWAGTSTLPTAGQSDSQLDKLSSFMGALRNTMLAPQGAAPTLPPVSAPVIPPVQRKPVSTEQQRMDDLERQNQMLREQIKQLNENGGVK